MNQLRFALETVDGGTFEDLAMDFLRAQGYGVHESGRPGRDGGWDARIELGGRIGIAHASTREDATRKLWEDAEKVKELEEDHNEDYDLFVFVTNQKVTGEQELDLKDEIRDEYGWTLQIHHQDNLLGEIRENVPELADRYLDIDLGTDYDHLRRIKQLRDDRVAAIRSRNGHATGLPDGPVVALHVIPNGLFSQEKMNSADLPVPPVLGELSMWSAETRGKEKVASGPGRNGGEYCSYGVLRNDGLYESANWSMIRDNEQEATDEAWTTGTVHSTGAGLDASVVIAGRRALNALREAGFSGAAFVSLSIVDAAHARLMTLDWQRGFGSKPPLLGRDVYATGLYQMPIGKDEVIADLEPLLSEVWRESGYEEGTVSIQDGTWAHGNVHFQTEPMLEEGDR